MKPISGVLLACLSISIVCGAKVSDVCNQGVKWVGSVWKKGYKEITFDPAVLTYDTITFDGCNSASNTKLQYSIDGGTNWINGDTACDDGRNSLKRTISNVASGTEIKIRIRGLSNAQPHSKAGRVSLTCATPAPTGVTLAPTDVTSAPTDSTPAPTSNTPSPTDGPTDGTHAPTGNTPAPTDSTSAPVTPAGGPAPAPPSCKRIRKPWHLLTGAERLLYINGFKELWRNGKIQAFSAVHASSDTPHGDKKFLSWHRHYLYEFESQFRALGGDWACFGLPYWDWVSEKLDTNGPVKDMYIFNSGLGDYGSGNNYCVGGSSNEGDGIGNDHFSVNGGGYTADGYCLRRDACSLDSCYWPGSDHGHLMGELNARDTFSAYRSPLETSAHNYAHMKVAGSGSSQIGSVAEAAYDPIFYMLHNFVDFQFALWQDCNGFEQVTANSPSFTDAMYPSDGRHIAMKFDILGTGGGGVSDWTTKPYVYHGINTVSPADVNSLIPWDVQYDRGQYFNEADVLVNDECQHNINGQVFVDTGLYDDTRRRLVGQRRERSELRRYTEDTYESLKQRFGVMNGLRSRDQSRRLYRALAKTICEYETALAPCIRPRYFDDCGCMEVATRDRTIIDQYPRQYEDIDISIEDLKAYHAPKQCMKETIEEMYSWAWETGNLKGLCKGDYYIFCDSFEDQDDETDIDDNTICDESDERRRRSGRRGAKRNGGYQSSHSVQSNVGDILNDDFMFDNGKLTEIQHILISGAINGLIISTILGIMYCCYKMKTSANSSKSHQAHKYDAVDAEYR